MIDISQEQERQSIPYSVFEARGAARDHRDMDIYHKELMEFLCDRVESLELEVAQKAIADATKESDKPKDTTPCVRVNATPLPCWNCDVLNNWWDKKDGLKRGWVISGAQPPQTDKAGDKLTIETDPTIPDAAVRPRSMGDEWYVRRSEEMESALQTIVRECYYCFSAESPEAKDVIVAKIKDVCKKVLVGDKL